MRLYEIANKTMFGPGEFKFNDDVKSPSPDPNYGPDAPWPLPVYRILVNGRPWPAGKTVEYTDLDKAEHMRDSLIASTGKPAQVVHASVLKQPGPAKRSTKTQNLPPNKTN